MTIRIHFLRIYFDNKEEKETIINMANLLNSKFKSKYMSKYDNDWVRWFVSRQDKGYVGSFYDKTDENYKNFQTLCNALLLIGAVKQR